MRVNYALSAEQKADAREALAILAGKMSLADAARLATAGTVMVRKEWDEAVDAYLRRLIAQKRSADTLAWYQQRLDVAGAVLAGLPLASLDRGTLRRAIEQGQAAPSQAATWRAVRAVLLYAAKQEPPWFDAGPLRGWNPVEVPQRKAEPHFLTVEQSERLLRGLPSLHLPAVVVQLFAGVRPEEVASSGTKPRLEWRHLNRADRMIRVPADVAKTRRARVIEGLPEALWAWLPPEPRTGPLCAVRSQTVALVCRTAVGLDRWPQDALRHTFATYAVALWGDAGRVALVLGHESGVGLLHRHYRGLTTKAEAERFFALRPGPATSR